MKIGIDTSRTADKKTGLERYAENLVKALAAIDHQNQYILYPFFWHCFPENPGKAVNPYKRNFKIRKFWTNSLTRKAWEAGRISRKKILGGDVDIVHSPFYAVPEEYLGKIIVTVHDLSFIRYPEFHTPENREFCLSQLEKIKKQADCVITVSEFSKKELVEIGGIDEQIIRVVYEAAAPIFKPAKDKNKFKKILKKFGIKKDYILYVGSVEPRKNLRTLIRAFSRVLENKIDCVLVLAGGTSWLTAELKEEISNLGLGEKVIFTGYVTDEELLGLYNLAQVFVYSSFYEGFGLPPLEAMASGCPVITSNASSLPEVVGEAGLMTAPDDFGDLAQKIEEVLTNPIIRKSLSEKSLIQSQKFSWAKAAGETLKIYEEVYQAPPNLPDAIIMGVDERGLGEGWQVLEKPGDFYYRWIKKSASCYLKNPAGGQDLLVALKVCSNFKEDNPQKLAIFADDNKVFETCLKYDWNSYSFKMIRQPSGRKIKFKLKVDKTMLPEKIYPDQRELGLMVEKISAKLDLKNFSYEKNMNLNQKEMKNREIILQSFPTGTFQLDITTKCNIDPPCIMCYKNVADEEYNNRGDISPALFGKVKDYLKYPSALYICSSGEPLCCARFWEILEKAQTDIVFNTNGLLLTEENTRKLLNSGKIKTISFSLDATTPETYQKIRGQDFNKVVKNIKRLAELKKEAGLKRPLIFASMVVMKPNIHEVLLFPDLARSVGIEALEFPLVLLFNNYKVLPNGQRLKKEDLKIDYEEYQRLMKQVKEKAESIGLQFRQTFGG